MALLPVKGLRQICICLIPSYLMEYFDVLLKPLKDVEVFLYTS